VWSGSVKGVGGFLRPDPPPPIVIGGFGPKMAELAGRVADGVNLPGGPGLASLLETTRTAVTAAGRDPSAFVVTASADLRPQALEGLVDLGVDRAVVFVGAPSASRVRKLAPGRR
jgi:alkanesulfonate monooxygenase SsuD/methylene tetrahydromethanopterin reductase-like flavin-dependent oxidoreductase (luciferase family)